jgi:hypothetical protein
LGLWFLIFLAFFLEVPNDTAVFRGHGERDVSGDILLVLVVARGDDAHRVFLVETDEDGKLDARGLLLDVAAVPTALGLLNERVCGVVWREGSPVDGSLTSSWGHWLAASHLPNLGDWHSHKWAYKDSHCSDAPIWSTEQVLNRLDYAERQRFDFFVVVDLA